MVKFYTTEFFQVQADCHFTSFSCRYTLKWKSVKETVVYICVTITTRNAITGEKWLESSLMLPDPLRAGAYQLDIINATLGAWHL